MNILPDELQRLLAEEPFVRALAKSLVADEADDVVQQAWVRAMAQRAPKVTVAFTIAEAMREPLRVQLR